MIMKILKTVLTTSLGLGLGLTGLDALAIESKELARAPVATNQPLYAKNDFDFDNSGLEAVRGYERGTIYKKTYYPQLSLSGFYGKNKNSYGGIDALLPIFENQNSLVFLDLRGILKSSPIKEFNVGGGYRWLTDDQDNLFGVYGFFDRKHSTYEQWFNQITVGGEFKTNQFSLGANLYLPITKNKQSVRVDKMHARPYEVTKFKLEYGEDVTTEYAMKGADLELGYAIPRVKGLTAYLGGYYFTHKETEKVAGPRAGLALDMIPYFTNVSPLLQHVQLEASVQHDKPRGTIWYAGLRLQMQLGGYRNQQKLTKLQRELTGFVRRDLDVIVGEDTVFESLGSYKKADGSDYVGQIVTNAAELNAVTTVGSGIDIIGVKASIALAGNTGSDPEAAIKLLEGQSITGQSLTFEEGGKTYNVAIVNSPNGAKNADPTAEKGELRLTGNNTGALLGVYSSPNPVSQQIQRIQNLKLTIDNVANASAAAVTNVNEKLSFGGTDKNPLGVNERFYNSTPYIGENIGQVVIDGIVTNAPVYFSQASGKTGALTVKNSEFDLLNPVREYGAITFVSGANDKPLPVNISLLDNTINVSADPLVPDPSGSIITSAHAVGINVTMLGPDAEISGNVITASTRAGFVPKEDDDSAVLAYGIYINDSFEKGAMVANNTITINGYNLVNGMSEDTKGKVVPAAIYVNNGFSGQVFGNTFNINGIMLYSSMKHGGIWMSTGIWQNNSNVTFDLINVQANSFNTNNSPAWSGAVIWPANIGVLYTSNPKNVDSFVSKNSFSAKFPQYYKPVNKGS